MTQYKIWHRKCGGHLLTETQHHLWDMSRLVREYSMSFYRGVLTPAYTSLTNCMWEGVCSQMEADWAPSTIKRFYVHSQARNAGILDLTDQIFFCHPHVRQTCAPVHLKQSEQVLLSD